MEALKEFPRGIRPLAQSSRRTAAGVRQQFQAASYKRQASGDKLQASSVKRQAKRQATSAVCHPNRQATGKAFRDDRL